MSSCKIGDTVINITYTNDERNILKVNNKKEIFFDVFECSVEGDKVVLETIDHYKDLPIVAVEFNKEGKLYNCEAVLVEDEINELSVNKENLYFLRSVNEEKDVEEIVEDIDEVESIVEDNGDNIGINYENIIEHHVNNKLVFLHALEEQFEEKLLSLKDDISDKLDSFYEKLEDKKKEIIEEKIQEISIELNDKFDILKKELSSVEDFSKKNVDNILETKVKEIDESVGIFLENITKEYKDRAISSDKKITENYLQLNSLKEKLKLSDTINNDKFGELFTLKDKLLEQDELIVRNKELLQFINDEFNTINNKFLYLSEEENKKYNDLLAAVSKKDVVEYKTILKEKIQEVELTQIKEALQDEISNTLRGDITALKRYVEMSSGGGSVAKQFANGGVMDGALNVTGNILSGGVNLADIFPSNGGGSLGEYLPLSGGNLTGTLSSNSTIIADSILATNLLSATNLDIGFELSGFNVTGSISASGDISAYSLSLSGDLNVDGLVDGRDIANDGNTIDTLKTDVIYLSSEIDSIDVEIDYLYTDIDYLSGEIDTNTSSITNLGTDITYLSGEIDTNTSSITNLGTDITYLSGEIDTNISSITNLGTDITYLSGEIDNNGTDITYLSGEIDGLTLDVITANGNITTNNVQVANLSATGKIIGNADSNIAAGSYTGIIGGRNNKANGNASTVGGGYENTANGGYSFVGGGVGNFANTGQSAIVGGNSNTANGYGYNFIGGGSGNTTGGYKSAIVGGSYNTASGYVAFVGGGANNTVAAGGYFGIAAGGFYNAVNAGGSVVGGGICNTSSGNFSVIAGGSYNVASGQCSGILGGRCNTVSHTHSFVIGSHLASNADCTTFVNNLSAQCNIYSDNIISNGTATVGKITLSNNSLVTETSSFTLGEEHRGATVLLQNSSPMTVTVTTQVSGHVTTFIAETSNTVTFAPGIGLSGFNSFNGANQIAGIYGQAQIIFKSPEYAFLGGNVL